MVSGGRQLSEDGELYKLYDEYQDKINELIKANADLDNLLVNAEIGALYLDAQLNIRKITPIIGKNTYLRLADTGKNIKDVRFMDGYQKLAEDAKKCLRDRKVIEREAEHKGMIWLLRFCPYYLSSGAVDGVIVIMFDVTKRLEAAKYELQLLIDSVPCGVAKMRYDNGLVIEYANDMLYKMMRTDKENIQAKYQNHYEQVLIAEDWVRLQQKIQECVQSGSILHLEYQVDYGGEEEWRMMQAVILENGDKPVLQCVITDITKTKRAYIELAQEQKKLDVIAQMASDMLFEYDIKRDSMKYTRHGAGIINPEQYGEHYVEHISNSGYVHPDDMGVLRQFCEELQGGKPKIHVELRKLYKDGEYHWVEIEGVSLCDRKGKAVKVIGKTQNIDIRKEREREFRERSEKDSLTGLLNHRVIREKINSRLAIVSDETECYLMVADIDNFKGVNDVNGHLFGDAVLCTFADKLKDSFPNALKGRIGGDEFMMLVEGTSEEELNERLARLQREFREMYREDGSGVKISCSCGLVRCDHSKLDADVLFQWADYALYQVKRQKKGTFAIVEPTGEEVPSAGYLNQRGIDENYMERDTLIHNADELVLFSLELLDNVMDIQNGLKMVSDRICKFFDFEDITFIQQDHGKKEKIYHWSSRQKRQMDHRTLANSSADWEYINNHYDEQGVSILHPSDMEWMEGETVGSVMLVRAKEHNYYNGCVAYVDREKDRDWAEERDVLLRLAHIIFNRLQKLHDNEEEKRLVDQQINYDSLTKLPQYFKFMELAEQRVYQNIYQSYYFIYSDFSNFQYLNEVYGYAAGDSVLKEFARELEDKCKGGVYFTRVTSDHFISMVEGESEKKVAEDFLELTGNFCERINARYDHCNLCLISGICQVLPEHGSISTTLDYANIARKYGKDKMETSVFLYDDKIRQQNEVEKTIVASMTTALENGEFHAFIQPKVSLKTGRIVGGEALVRWIRSDGSMIYPDKFIPVFEKNGFITKVDFCVLEQVLDYLEKAREQGEEIVPISVNFSRKHNEEAAFTDSVKKRLEKYHVPKGMLEAEVTESVFMQDLTALNENIDRFHEYGMTIAIDDFGSGYSSLNVLASVPVDVIKMDKKFFNFVSEEAKNKDFIKYVIRMLKHLGMTTVMEGVETKEQLEFLKECSCDVVQGYYYAKPMPIPEFRKFLAEFNAKAKTNE